MYKWLSIQMGLSMADTHVSKFTRAQCRQAIKILRPKYIQIYGHDLPYKVKGGKYMTKISMPIEFEVAYILSSANNYGNLYSHSYKLEVLLTGTCNKENGMILPYQVIDTVLHNVIPDHQFIYYDKDVISSEIALVLKKYDVPHLKLDFPISTENLVKYLYNQVNSYIKDTLNYSDITLLSAKLTATDDNSYAEYSEVVKML